MLRRSALRRLVSAASDRGIVDMPSVFVGTALAGLTLAVGGTAATVALPYAFDTKAKQALTSIQVAQSEAKMKGFLFTETAGLGGAIDPTVVTVATDPAGVCYIAAAKSRTGKVFYITSASTALNTVTDTTSTDWCTPIDQVVSRIGKTPTAPIMTQPSVVKPALPGLSSPAAAPVSNPIPAPVIPAPKFTVPAQTITAVTGFPITGTASTTGEQVIYSTQGLPKWAKFDAATGKITGEAGTAGTTTFAVTAISPHGTAVQSVTVQVKAPIATATASNGWELNSALDLARDGAIIRMTGDIGTAAYAMGIGANKAVTLDLAGRSVNLSTILSTKALSMGRSSTLTIIDSAGGGRFVLTGGKSSPAIGSSTTGNDWTVNIKGGTIMVTGSNRAAVGDNPDTFTLNISGGIVNSGTSKGLTGSKGKVTITGGLIDGSQH